MVIFRAAVDRKTLPQQNRVESLNNIRNALELKAGFTVVSISIIVIIIICMTSVIAM